MSATDRDQAAAVVRSHAAAWLESRGLGTAYDRETAAASKWLGPALADRLSRSARANVRTQVAANPVTPVGVVTRLTRDRLLNVRQHALSNPACPFDVVAAHEDGDPTTHADCPAEVLVGALDRDPYDDRVLAHPHLPAATRARVAATASTTRLWQLLSNPTTTHAEALGIFALLLEGAMSVATWKWAANPNADPDWLARTCAAQHGRNDGGTLAHIAENPATPAATLVDIVRRRTHADYALRNPSCPVEALHAELDRWDCAPASATNSYDAFRASSQARVAMSPNADRVVLDRIPCEVLPQTRLYSFALVHARTADQARVLLTLAPEWPGTLAELLDTAATVAAPAARARTTTGAGANAPE